MTTSLTRPAPEPISQGPLMAPTPDLARSDIAVPVNAPEAPSRPRQGWIRLHAPESPPRHLLAPANPARFAASSAVLRAQEPVALRCSADHRLVAHLGGLTVPAARGARRLAAHPEHRAHRAAGRRDGAGRRRHHGARRHPVPAVHDGRPVRHAPAAHVGVLAPAAALARLLHPDPNRRDPVQDRRGHRVDAGHRHQHRHQRRVLRNHGHRNTCRDARAWTGSSPWSPWCWCRSSC